MNNSYTNLCCRKSVSLHTGSLDTGGVPAADLGSPQRVVSKTTFLPSPFVQLESETARLLSPTVHPESASTRTVYLDSPPHPPPRMIPLELEPGNESSIPQQPGSKASDPKLPSVQLESKITGMNDPDHPAPPHVESKTSGVASHVTGPGGDAPAATIITTEDSMADGTSTIPSSDAAGGQEPMADRRKKKSSKKRVYEIVLSTSDEEADTVKDVFWRDLDAGHLREDLTRHTDLASQVNCVKRLMVSSGKPVTELRSVICHMGSYSVTCHPTQVNVLCLDVSQVGQYSIHLPHVER